MISLQDIVHLLLVIDTNPNLPIWVKEKAEELRAEYKKNWQSQRTQELYMQLSAHPGLIFDR